MTSLLAIHTYDLRSCTLLFLASRVTPFIAACKSFASVWKVMSLGCSIDRDPRQILRPQRPALVRHPQALGQEKFQLAAEALAPMAQVRALVRKLMLEELLSSEVLEVWIIDPSFAHAFVGQSVNMLEKKKPDHKLCRNSRPATVAVQRRDLAVDELPVDLARELH